MAIINIHEAKTHLSRLIARAEAGEEIVIACGNEPVVRLTPAQGARFTACSWPAEEHPPTATDFSSIRCRRGVAAVGGRRAEPDPMRLLLDTHAYVWWVTNEPKRSRRALDVTTAPNAEFLISAVELWDTAIKVRLGNRPGGGAILANLDSALVVDA